MKLKSVLGIVAGVLGILLGIVILIVSIMEIEVPKLIWLLFAGVGFVNAIGNIANYKRSKKTDSNIQ